MVTTNVFDWNYSDREHRIKINQGGTSSSKTYSILQVIFLRLLEEKLIATVVGQDIPNLKKGALRDFQQRVLVDNPWMQQYIENYHKTERIYTMKNGSILEFNSYSDAQDAKNGKRDILFVNEANGVAWPIYEQLEMRTSKEVFIDYNPTESFWAHEKLMHRDNAVTYYSNFTHNPYADPNIVEYLFSIKHEDPETWRVYGLGMTGALAETIFKEVTIVPEMPRNLKKQGFGMDFGYTADPTTLIHCGLQNERDVYCDEQFYQYRMKGQDIHLTLGAMGLSRSDRVYADSAEARLCDELKAKGWNIIPVDKGRDSVRYGIQLLKQYNLHITERSMNILNEQRKYKWKVDKKTGNITNEPVDAFNHAWDAIRYWAQNNLKPLRPIRSQFRTGVA